MCQRSGSETQNLYICKKATEGFTSHIVTRGMCKCIGQTERGRVLLYRQCHVINDSFDILKLYMLFTITFPPVYLERKAPTMILAGIATVGAL